MFWIFAALAQAQTAAPAAAPAGDQPSMLMSLVPFIFMIAVFYFLVARPQAKRQRTQQAFLSALKRGDEVLTSGGLLGRIEGLTDHFVTLEISDGVRVKVLRSQISASGKPDNTPKKDQ